MTWHKFDGGSSLGGTGSERGVIIRDDEHSDAARITLERDGGTAPFAITCGVYGWMVHTRFFGSEAEAQGEFDAMAAALTDLVASQPVTNSEDLSGMVDEISAFVARFP
jgi:hypothetical protein